MRMSFRTLRVGLALIFGASSLCLLPSTPGAITTRQTIKRVDELPLLRCQGQYLLACSDPIHQVGLSTIDTVYDPDTGIFYSKDYGMLYLLGSSIAFTDEGKMIDLPFAPLIYEDRIYVPALTFVFTMDSPRFDEYLLKQGVVDVNIPLPTPTGMRTERLTEFTQKLAIFSFLNKDGGQQVVYEQRLKMHLHEIRTALEQFNADCGVYPDKLTDLLLSPQDAKTRLQYGHNWKGEQVKIDPKNYTGPYLAGTNGIDGTAIPSNPYGPIATGNLDADIAAHWVYANKNGIIFAAAPADGQTTDGIPYKEL